MARPVDRLRVARSAVKGRPAAAGEHFCALNVPDIYDPARRCQARVHLRNKPWFVVNGGRDPLYPTRVVDPYMRGAVPSTPRNNPPEPK